MFFTEAVSFGNFFIVTKNPWFIAKIAISLIKILLK